MKKMDSMKSGMTLLFGDTLDEMRKLEDDSINHIISDWPFFGIVTDDWDNQWKNETEYLNWCEDIIKEYNRIVMPNGNIIIFTGRQYNRKISIYLDKYFTEKRIIIWSRKRNFNNTRGMALASGYEPISYYTNGKIGTFNNIKVFPKTDRKEYTTGILKDGITMSDVWSDINALPHNSKEKLKHSTQKPYKLIERLVLQFTNENDIILDNLAGTGTLGEVCINNNRNSILIENNKEYIDIIKTRMKKYKFFKY